MVNGPNTYGFCGGDPVNRADPMGTSWVWTDFGWLEVIEDGVPKPTRFGTSLGEFYGKRQHVEEQLSVARERLRVASDKMREIEASLSTQEHLAEAGQSLMDYSRIVRMERESVAGLVQEMHSIRGAKDPSGSELRRLIGTAYLGYTNVYDEDLVKSHFLSIAEELKKANPGVVMSEVVGAWVQAGRPGHNFQRDLEEETRALVAKLHRAGLELPILEKQDKAKMLAFGILVAMAVYDCAAIVTTPSGARMVALDTDAVLKLRSSRALLRDSDVLVITRNVLWELENRTPLGAETRAFLAAKGIRIVETCPGVAVSATRIKLLLDIIKRHRGNAGDALNVAEAGGAGAEVFVTADKTMAAVLVGGTEGVFTLPLSNGVQLTIKVIK